MSTYQVEAWQLDDLFLGWDDPAFQTVFDDIETKVTEFEAFRSELSPELSGERFVFILQQLEKLQELARTVQAYVTLRFAADTQDQQTQSYLARGRQVLAQASNRTMFFQLWWQELDDAPAGNLRQHAPNHQYWLDKLRQRRPYTLTESEERIISLKNVNGSNALNQLYASITNRYTFKLTVDGEEQEMPLPQLIGYIRHPKAHVRKGAYQAMLNQFAKDAPILGQIYQALVRDWHSENVDLRQHKQPISVRNLSNDIPDGVVDTLIEVALANAPVFHRFFRLKAHWLGVEQLSRFDIYAPLGQASVEYPYDQAVKDVLTSFREFEPEIAELAQRVFDEHHLDGEVRQGKQGGAFCAAVLPPMTPWILQSYSSRPDDIATLAHELGHAIHAMLSTHHHIFHFQPSLPLAETASTFAEMIFVDYLLGNNPDPDLQRDLLFKQVDDAYATILRQIYFAKFERDAHQKIHEGASIDELSDLYFANIQHQFGSAVKLEDEFRYEWVSIPHIYQVPFYVYAYAFGQLLVLSLYRQYQQEGAAFKPRYLDILRAGGSASPLDILANAGLDVTRPEFWQGGFDVLASMVERLEAIPISS